MPCLTEPEATREVSFTSPTDPRSRSRDRRERPERGEPDGRAGASILDRIGRLAARTGDTRLGELAKRLEPGGVPRFGLDSRLMANFATHRDHEAFALLYEVSVGEVSRIVGRVARNAPPWFDPDDAVQESFLSIYRYPGRFRDTSDRSFYKWVYSIARNAVLKQLGAKRDRLARAGELHGLPAEQRHRDALASLAEKESKAELSTLWLLFLMAYRKAFLSRLNEREQVAIALTDDQGMSHQAVANLLNLRVEATRMLLSRARRKILYSISA